MTNPESTTAVTGYLDRLRSALAPAPADLRDEIVAGVREELTGLDDAAASARIAQLGDPALIAAEALEGLPAPKGKRPLTYLLFTVGLLVIGGYVIPVIGWLIGLVLVIGSNVWTKHEKTVAVAVSAGASALALVLLFAFRGPELGVWALAVAAVLSVGANLFASWYLTRRWFVHTA
jgi:hypothetical protein